jgi:cytochrome c-type biogenesis protein CcmH
MARHAVRGRWGSDDTTIMNEALLFTGMAALTALAVLGIIVPLLRAPALASSGRDDESVYRDQLAQLDRDVARGLLAPSEAAGARTEVARRLLAAAADRGSLAGKALPESRSTLARILLVAIPVTALGAYLWTGAPELPAMPLAARMQAVPSTADPQALLARAEAELQRNPQSVEGWRLMAPIYLRLGRYEDAARAWAALIRLEGADAERQTMLGVALVGQAGGIVTPEARAAFDRALAIDPKYPQARISLALAQEQDGDRAGAVATLRALGADLPAGAPLLAGLQQEIARLEAAPAPPKGPTGADIAAASSMSADQQSAMARGMVEGLAGRLAAQGGSAEEWLRLVRGYQVLGEPDRAQAAAQAARQALAGDPEALARIDALLAPGG